MAAVLTEPKTIQLSESSKIVFDWDGRLYRAAYYHPIKTKTGQLVMERDTAKAFKLVEMLYILSGNRSGAMIDSEEDIEHFYVLKRVGRVSLHHQLPGLRFDRVIVGRAIESAVPVKHDLARL